MSCKYQVSYLKLILEVNSSCEVGWVCVDHCQQDGNQGMNSELDQEIQPFQTLKTFLEMCHLRGTRVKNIRYVSEQIAGGESPLWTDSPPACTDFFHRLAASLRLDSSGCHASFPLVLQPQCMCAVCLTMSWGKNMASWKWSRCCVRGQRWQQSVRGQDPSEVRNVDMYNIAILQNRKSGKEKKHK